MLELDMKHVMKYHASPNIPLSYDEAFALGVRAIAGCRGDALAQIQSIAGLSALHNKATYAWRWSKADQARHDHALPESAAEQIAGVCAAVFTHDMETSKFGYLTPNVSYAMDNCGMGGDMRLTANVSTIAAFIAAAAGIPMCKHGSPANADAGRHGSSDFISLLGINTMADRRAVERCVEECSFGYTEALNTNYKSIHLQTHSVALLPHMNDVIGPITNPLHRDVHRRRAFGVNHLIPPRVIAETYRILNKKGVTNLSHGLFFRGYAKNGSNDGMDEVSLCAAGTDVAELKDGDIMEYRLHASDFGVQAVDPEDISPPRGMSKGEFSRRILFGEVNGAAMQMVYANAAILFYLAERGISLRKCYAMAEDVHKSGKVIANLESIKQHLPAL